MIRPAKKLSTHLRARRSSRERQAGVALMTVMGVITVTGLLSVVAVQLALHSSSTTLKDRQRVVATSAAEAGVDLTLVNLKGSAGLPCTLPQGTLTTKPTNATYTVTVKYYNSYPPTGTPMPCTGATLVGEPKAALITSDGTGAVGSATAPIKRMEALAKITAIPGNGFDKAIFADTALTIANSTHILGNTGNDANVYANAPVTCGNSIEVAGGIMSQYDVTLNNSCKIATEVYAKNNVNMANTASVGFDVKSSQGNIVAMQSAKIGRDGIAKGTITGSAIAAGNPVRNKVEYATIPDPPYQPLPQVGFVPEAWTANGYAIVYNNTCSGGGSVYNSITALGTATVPTVIVTDCKIAYTNSTTNNLKQNVAIFAKGGFHFKNSTTWKNMSTPTRLKLYLITPYGSTCTPYVNPNDTGLGNLYLSNSTEFPDLDVFMYTPCTFSGANSTHFEGQVYAKNANIVNSYEMKFVPLPVHGASGGGGSSTYAAEIVYKREDIAK